MDYTFLHSGRSRLEGQEQKSCLWWRYTCSIILYSVLGLVLMTFLGCKDNPPIPLGVGEMFPNLILANLQGEKVAFPGKTNAKMILVSIRTIGCRFCASDFIELERLYQDYSRDELDVTVINVGAESSSVQRFLAGKDISFAVLIDQEMKSMHQTHTIILPVAYLVDQNSTVLYRLNGSFSAAEITSLMEKEVAKGRQSRGRVKLKVVPSVAVEVKPTSPLR